MSTKRHNCLIIDYVQPSKLLKASLRATGSTQRILATSTVRTAWPYLVKGNIDMVFVPMQRWEQFQSRLKQLKSPPTTIVFLSKHVDEDIFSLFGKMDFLLRLSTDIEVVKLFSRN